jgi:hypothetical protein
VIVSEPGRTRLELTGDVELESLVRLMRPPGELTRFSVEPPTLSDLFHEAVGR